MHPGGACISCHATTPEAPTLALGGTVYPTAHEPDDCMGAAGATVEITDANGVVTTLPSNGSGNFLFEGTVAFPYTARVLYQGRERRMMGSRTTGNCGSCHTETGKNGAPGRIMLP